MTAVEWTDLYGDGQMFSLTNEERAFFALNPAPTEGEKAVFYCGEKPLCSRVTAFFDGEVIVKVITETLGIGQGHSVWMREYEEYDTFLLTRERQWIAPLSKRGSEKKLTASTLKAVRPFGCKLYVKIRNGDLFKTEMYLVNPRSRKRFPLGEWSAIENIRSEEDFRSFVSRYISECGKDYAEKIRVFRESEKDTVKYRDGDIFRVDFDRTRYCYGIITGRIKRVKAICDLPEKHSLSKLMTVPITIRMYSLVTEDPNLGATDLAEVPLGRALICSDNDLSWGTYPIVDHRPLTYEDLDFSLNCVPEPHYSGRFTLEGCSLYVEWGFAWVTIPWEEMSDSLKRMTGQFYHLKNGGVYTGIDPRFALSSGNENETDYVRDLLSPRFRNLKEEVFACLGLDADTTYDQFAQRFGGLTRQEIFQRMTKK